MFDSFSAHFSPHYFYDFLLIHSTYLFIMSSKCIDDEKFNFDEAKFNVLYKEKPWMTEYVFILICLSDWG
jgi:hypothetical protein